MLKKNLTILVAMVLLLVSTAGIAQSKDDLARELLEITKSSELALQIIHQILSVQKQQNPDVPANFWTELEREFKAEDLTALVVPVYARHFTEDELKAIIAFYRTPAGEKMIAAMPQISRESMEIGQTWGMQIGQKVVDRIQAAKQ